MSNNSLIWKNLRNFSTLKCSYMLHILVNIYFKQVRYKFSSKRFNGLKMVETKF